MRAGVLTRRSSYILIFILLFSHAVVAEDASKMKYEQARWDPIHYKPAIESASNEQCLACHKEILDVQTRKVSMAGVKAEDMKAWYQTLSTYNGEQQSFHARHLTSEYAQKVMDLKCNTCHQGNDLREEAYTPPDHNRKEYTLRKSVNPEICLMCHGRNPYELMGLPSPWSSSRVMFQENCMLCHNLIRTNRHRVNFLKPDAIEEEGAKDSDVCYGCHGGRQWYRIAYPYPRNAWKGMAETVPEWAKERPTESEPRFRLNQKQAAK